MSDLIITLLIVAVISCAGFAALSIFFVCRLVSTISKLKASNNVYEFQQLERDMTPFKRKKEKEVPLTPAEKSGQVSTDGTLTEEAIKNLSSKI